MQSKSNSRHSHDLRAKWNRNLWKYELDDYIQQTKKKKKDILNIIRPKKNFSFLNFLLKQREIDDKNEMKLKNSLSAKILKRYCLNFNDSFINTLTLRHISLDIIAKNLPCYDTHILMDLVKYLDIETVSYLSGFSVFYNQLNDNTIILFANIQCEWIILGDISDDGLYKLFPSIRFNQISESDWENAEVKPTGCFSLRNVTFVKSSISTAGVINLLKFIPKIECLRFIDYKCEGFCELLEILSDFSKLHTLEISYCSILTPELLEIWLIKLKLIINHKKEYREKFVNLTKFVVHVHKNFYSPSNILQLASILHSEIEPGNTFVFELLETDSIV